MKRNLAGLLITAATCVAWLGTGSALAHDNPPTPPKPVNNLLEAKFTPAPIAVDGLAEAAWSAAPAAPLAHAYNPAMTGPPAAACAISGDVRALWDGAVLYLLVSVTDPLVTTAATGLGNRDGVEFWIDHFNDKKAKFEEDDGTMTITAPPVAFTANRPQNTVYDNVSTRYLKSYASALRTDAAGATLGYSVEIAWYLGEHARANGSTFGFDFGINEADATNSRQCRLFWNPATANRTTNDNREWGTVKLAGFDGSAPKQIDTFMLSNNIAKANALVRGIWRDESQVDSALERANTALVSNNQYQIDWANGWLDAALRGLRRHGPFKHGIGPFPDALDLPLVKHLNDPFRFFNGRRVRSLADWDARREELKELLQYYELGMKPPKPLVLTAVSVTNGQSRNITISMTDNGRNAAFTPRLTLPTAAQAAASGKAAPFPVIVSLDFAVGNGNANYLNAGYAVLSIPTGAVQSDNVAHTGAIFDLYPYSVADGTDFGCLLGWAWGASRAVDALELLVASDPAYLVEGTTTPLIALDKLSVTGFSRWGKGALATGMLDARFKVTHTGASGSGGAAPYRYIPFDHQYAWGFTGGSETLGDHMRHQTHNSNEMMRRFLNDTFPSTVQGRIYETRTHGYGERLPFDHHLEIAAIAPRAVLIANTNDDYGNNAEGDVIGYEGAKAVFEYLGAGDRLAVDLYLGGGGHSLKVSQQHNFVRFLDYVLYGVPLPNSVPPGDATSVPTDVQLRHNPYLTGGAGGTNIYDTYFGGLASMMPWRPWAPHANLLSSLTLSEGAIAPRLSETQTHYFAHVRNSVRSIRVTALGEDPRATLTVNGAGVGNGAESGEIPLKVGRNNVEIEVTAVDGDKRLYKVTIERAGCFFGWGHFWPCHR
jgi:endo-1,4-beta-xylanase